MDASDRRKHAAGEASDWFSRLQAGPMERAERDQFVEWLRESHLHVAAMLRIAQIHGALERFQGWSRIRTGPRMDADNVVQFPPPRPGGARIPQDPDSAPPGPRSFPSSPAPLSPTSPPRRTGPGPRFFACTTLLLLVVGMMTVVPRLRGQVIETEQGERREVVLADGSVLEIDPQTRLRVEYADAARRVILEQGRALFHVARNPNRPFLVEADDTTVRAVGTAFGVEQRPHGVVVTVAEGKVSVSVPRLAERAAEPGPAPSQGKIFLTANQQLMVAAAGRAEPVRQVDSARVLAWAEGRLIFENDELGQAVAQFNRYNRVRMTVTDPILARKTVSGVFNAAEPEAFIAFLQSVTSVEIVRDGDQSITIAARY